MFKCGAPFEWQGRIIDSCDIAWRMRDQTLGNAIATLSVFLLVSILVFLIALKLSARYLKNKQVLKSFMSILLLAIAVIGIWYFGQTVYFLLF